MSPIEELIEIQSQLLNIPTANLDSSKIASFLADAIGLLVSVIEEIRRDA